MTTPKPRAKKSTAKTPTAKRATKPGAKRSRAIGPKDLRGAGDVNQRAAGMLGEIARRSERNVSDTKARP
jgi:hypothetical protein